MNTGGKVDAKKTLTPPSSEDLNPECWFTVNNRTVPLQFADSADSVCEVEVKAGAV